MPRQTPGQIIRAAQAALTMPLPSDMRRAIRDAFAEYHAQRVFDFQAARAALARTLGAIFEEWGYEGSLAS